MNGPCHRRAFFGTAAALGAGAALGTAAAAEAGPETLRLRLPRFPLDVACVSPLWIAEALLRAEGFETIEYVELTREQQIPALADARIDFDLRSPFAPLLALDAGLPLLVLGGLHAGCYELFGGRGVRSIRELGGRRIGVGDLGRQAFVSMMLQHVGLDPRRSVRFVDTSSGDGVRLLAEGAIDAYLGFPPEPQQVRARRLPVVSLVDTAIDRPWSQYFCCSVVSSRHFVERHPVATRRALRAFVKAADLCSSDPEGVVRALVERGFLRDAPSAREALRRIPYRRWRDYDSADTLRYYALRMHEVGALRSDPNTLLARGADWRFIEQVKRELKT